ncbi:MAG TPA: hypothetical protein VNE39_00275 [Planctomycetota bacterium]|nr:hypothetical protein [Planctomycetota bacterium]
MLRWRRQLPALVAALLLGNARAGAPVLEHFITRRGNKLMEGDREFRFLGANMPGLILPYDFTLRIPERMTLPTPWEQEDAFKTLTQMGLRVVRLWNLPIRPPQDKAQGWHYVLGPGQFNDEAFKTPDHLLALANRYGVRVIFDFTAGSGDYLGGVGTYAAHRGKKRAEFFSDPQLKDDYKATVRHVLSRTNSVTGTAYKDDKAILAWQFGNEIQEAPEAWCSEMAAYVKSLDPNHLVIDTRHRRVPQPDRPDPNIDIYTRHYYPGDGDWVKHCEREWAALKGQRPLVVGEYGPYFRLPAERARAVAAHRRFLDHVAGSELSGALLWSMYFHHRDGGFYWHQIFTYPSVWSYHWPGFPSGEAQAEREILGALREAAFRVQGRPVPPVPVPDPPQLLPVGDVPLLSWRGSAGASGYDVERAPDPAGPWARIARNVSDADVAYRPLYSDTTARAGQTCHYRVVARNASGESEPSNVVGPVKVRAVCLADELATFALAHARSDGLTLANEYNALYAERLFRAKGESGAWLAYKAPGDIAAFKAVAWFPKAPEHLRFQASPDGVAFQNLAPQRHDRAYPSPPGGPAGGQRRTRVEYAGSLPPAQRFLKIIWTGPAELDRVELFHSGE